MRIRIRFLLLILLFTILFEGCTDNNNTNTEAKENSPQSDLKTDKQASANNNIVLQAPDFADPSLKRYYSDYTGYLIKVVTSIRNKDSAGAMNIFREEGKRWNNMKEIEEKAKAADEQKFTTWLMQSIPLQTEIIQSDYYKKFSEEYYKKVREKVKTMD